MGKGTNGNPLVLDGAEIRAEEVERLRKQDRFFDQEALRCEVQLCTDFGAHEKLAAMLLELNGADIAIIGSPFLLHYALARGVSSFAAYRKTKKKGYLKMGMRMRSKMRSWLSKGNPNVLHLASFLDAEYHASKGKLGTAIKHFESAVLMSACGGLLFDAVFVSERFGELYLENDDEENASFRLKQAIRYYKDVDAYGKVDDLEIKYGHLMSKPKEILTSTLVGVVR
jgi:hypothetical protein